MPATRWSSQDRTEEQVKRQSKQSANAARIAESGDSGAAVLNLPDPSHIVLRPARQTLPLVLASPHSGRCYPPEFIAASRLDAQALRRSEDAFVDELFDFVTTGEEPEQSEAAETLGAPLLCALFPRAYIDPNREAYELDPAMFCDSLPDFANTRSPRVAAGLGTLARIVAGGAEIYRTKLHFAEAQARVEKHYRPYHEALRRLIDETRETFGYCILLDCHSMPSVGGPSVGGPTSESEKKPAPAGGHDPGPEGAAFVLGDCHSSSCARPVIEAVEKSLSDAGYKVARNVPYAGGFVTRHYGRPGEGVHALQVEINRALYMDERCFTRGPGMARLRADLRCAVESLATLNPIDLKPKGKGHG